MKVAQLAHGRCCGFDLVHLNIVQGMSLLHPLRFLLHIIIQRDSTQACQFAQPQTPRDAEKRETNFTADFEDDAPTGPPATFAGLTRGFCATRGILLLVPLPILLYNGAVTVNRREVNNSCPTNISDKLYRAEWRRRHCTCAMCGCACD